MSTNDEYFTIHPLAPVRRDDMAWAAENVARISRHFLIDPRVSPGDFLCRATLQRVCGSI